MTPGIVIEAPHPDATAIKAMILERLDEIDATKEKLKEAREMLTNAYENDQKFRDAKKSEDKFKREKTAIQDRIKNENPTATDKIEELKESLKEANDALSDYLAEFVRMTGKMELRRNDGREVKIVRKFKVSPGQEKLF